MVYVGSKARYAKFILPHILKNRKPNQTYVEPFVGGASIISEVTGNRIGADINKYIIALWKAVSEDGWLPKKSYSKKDYDSILSDKDKDPILTGYLGCTQSFGSKFLGGYARSIRADDTSGHTKAINSYTSSLGQFPKLHGVKFYCCAYNKLNIPKNSIIYCDPPYRGTYSYNTDFNSDTFWRWAEDMTDAGHRVLVSEYEAPDGWGILWNQKVSVNLNARSGVALSRTEKLFIKLKL